MAAGRTGAVALFSVVALSAACGNLSQTAVNAMMGGIVADFGIDVGLGQWLTTSYMLVLGITVPAVTWMSRRFSARQHVLLALGLFLAGAAACMLAPNFWVLLAGRVLQAMSTGMLMPLLQTIAMVSFPPGRQATAMGIAGVAMGFAPNIGPTVGGAMEFAWGWRSFFGLLALLALVLAAASVVCIARAEPRDRAARLDAASLALSALGFGGVLLGCSNASGFGVASPFVWAPLAAGAAFLAAFVVRQKRVPSPLISMDIFRSAQYRAGLVAQCLLFVSYMGVTLVVPLYVEDLCGGTALDAGLVLLPGTAAALVMNPLGGILTDRIGARPVCIGASACLAAGAALMVLLDEQSPLWMAMVFQGVRAMGVSGLIGPITQWGLAKLPRTEVPDGSSFGIAVRQALASFGTSVMVLAISSGGALAAAAGVPAGAAFPYQLAFAFSAVAAAATFAMVVWKVR